MTIYETQQAQDQARRERVRLAVVAYLRRRGGSQVSVTAIARAIGDSPSMVGRVVLASPRTFRTRMSYRRQRKSGKMVELHPHLVEAWA